MKRKRAHWRPPGSPTSSQPDYRRSRAADPALNGYKISNPTVLARIAHEELEQFFRGCGWTPYFVEGDEPEKMHQLMASILEKAIEEIRQIQSDARNKTTPLGRAGQ